MKNTHIDAEQRHGLRDAWGLTDFTLDFTDCVRYKKAVRILLKSKKYKLLQNGRYLYGPVYGYVTFRKREA